MRFMPLYRYYRFIGMNIWDAPRLANEFRTGLNRGGNFRSYRGHN